MEFIIESLYFFSFFLNMKHLSCTVLCSVLQIAFTVNSDSRLKCYSGAIAAQMRQIVPTKKMVE